MLLAFVDCLVFVYILSILALGICVYSALMLNDVCRCTVELNITGSVDVIDDDDDEIMEGDVDTGPPEVPNLKYI